MKGGLRALAIVGMLLALVACGRTVAPQRVALSPPIHRSRLFHHPALRPHRRAGRHPSRRRGRGGQDSLGSRQ